MIEARVQNPFFDTLAVGRFFQGNVVVREHRTRAKHPGFREYIIDAWEQAGSPPRGLRRTWTFPKPPEVVNGALHLSVAQSSFMEFASTRNAQTRRFYQPDLATVDAVGTSILVETNDNKLLVATKWPENRGALNVIGGYPDVPNDDSRPHAQPDTNSIGQWDPFATITRELAEETGIQPHELSDLHLTGVIFSHSKRSKQPIITSFAKTTLDSQNIKQLTTNNEVDVCFIPNTPGVIENLLAYPDAIIRTATANLLFYGREHFGEKWFSEMNRRLTEEFFEDMRRNGQQKEEVRQKGVLLFEAFKM